MSRIRYERGTFDYGLSGISDIFTGAFWVQEWNAAVAKFKSIIGSFLALDEKLLKGQARIRRMFDAPNLDSDQLARIKRLNNDNAALLDNQHRLESEVTDAAAKAGDINAQLKADQQMGVATAVLLAGAAALATVVAVTGAVIIHTQRVNAHLADIDAVERGVLTPEQAAALGGSSSWFPELGDFGRLLMIGGGVMLGVYAFTSKRK